MIYSKYLTRDLDILRCISCSGMFQIKQLKYRARISYATIIKQRSILAIFRLFLKGL